jgi:hypothetical protein
MSGVSDEKVCAYCGEPVLTGAEDPEHAVPAAVSGRLTTTAVCTPCNRWAGRDIDQPWLDDPLVLDCRFEHQIPDRRGRTVNSSPFLMGRTDDGRRVTIGRDGAPVLRNTPVMMDEATGVMRITAADADALKAQKDKQVRKLQAAGRTVTPIETSEVSDQPLIAGSGCVEPGRWHRMGAKIALALLAEQQSATWRRGDSASRLRAAMRSRPTASEVRFVRLEAVAAFAPRPATAVVVSRPGPIVVVSLLGIFGVGFVLAEDLDRIDWAWVANPLNATADAEGSLAEVIYARHRAEGLLDEPHGED